MDVLPDELLLSRKSCSVKRNMLQKLACYPLLFSCERASLAMLLMSTSK